MAKGDLQAPTKGVPSLDQERAKRAWIAVQRAREALGDSEFGTYRNVAKSAPALIMNSGLMPTLAFYRGKSKQKSAGAARTVEGRFLDDLLAAVVAGMSTSSALASSEFPAVMEHLHGVDGQEYMRWTREALAYLTWLRHNVDAVGGGQ
jgi:CRISPR-associated protein Cmr5